MLQPEKAVFSQIGVMVGKTLADLQGEQVPVRLLNLSNKPRKIKKGLHSLPVKELFEREAINLVPCQKDVLYKCTHCYMTMPISFPRGQKTWDGQIWPNTGLTLLKQIWPNTGLTLVMPQHSDKHLEDSHSLKERRHREPSKRCISKA